MVTNTNLKDNIMKNIKSISDNSGNEQSIAILRLTILLADEYPRINSTILLFRKSYAIISFEKLVRSVLFRD